MPYAAAPMVLTLLISFLLVMFIGGMIACAIGIFVSDYRTGRENRQRWRNLVRTGRYEL